MNQQQLIDQQVKQQVVLVIDDNPAVRDMVSWALELDGYISARASEGQEALDWLQEAAREGRYPTVILLDISMPGMDGLTFLQHLRGLNTTMAIPKLPSVVIITAAQGAYEASTLGVAKVITKPFHVRDLLNTISQLAQKNV